MSVKIYFDLDGTVFDLYGKPNWLELLESENPDAFKGEFLPEINLTELHKVVFELWMNGVEFGVITWLPMNASPEYQTESAKAKSEWVRKNMGFVTEFNAIPYGVPKQKAIQQRAKKMYLIDDNSEVCAMWETNKQRKAVNVNKDFTVVHALKKILENLYG